jgi:branched-chain amino acid transport system substrate-binding protein
VLGRRLEADFIDNRCNPAESVKLTTDVISQKRHVAIFDGLCSSAVLAMMPLAERASMPYLVVNASATSITEKTGKAGNKWVFKYNPSDHTFADAMVRHLQSKGQLGQIALLAEDSDFGRGGGDAWTAALAKVGAKLQSTNYFQQNTADFTSALTRIRSQKPSAVAVYSVGADFQNIVRQVRGFNFGIPLTGRLLTDAIPKDVLESGALDGSTSVQNYASEIDTPGNRAFVAAYRKMHNDEVPSGISMASYESMKIFADAIRRAGRTDGDAIRDALQATRFPALLGGFVEFDDFNLAHNFAVILVIEKGVVRVAGLSKT